MVKEIHAFRNAHDACVNKKSDSVENRVYCNMLF